MSIFTKSISELTVDDLQELVLMQAVENVRLEFKREVPSKDELLKKVSSFANTYGGMLVVGAEAKSADGRIIGLPGVDLQTGYKQTISQWCFSGTTPPLNIEVSDPITVASGRVCYVLAVRESETAPHFLNGRKGIYVRTDEFSSRFDPHLATEHEVRHLLDRRQLIRERRTDLITRARQRFTTFVQSKPPQESSDTRPLGAHIDLTIIPRFPAVPACDHARLISILQEQTLSWRGTSFPLNLHGLISQHESVLVLQRSLRRSLIEANIWGMLSYATEIAEQRREYAGIHLNAFLGHLLVYLRHAGTVMGKLGILGPLHVELMLHSIRGIPWITFEEGFATPGSHSPLDDAVRFSLEATTDGLCKEPNAVAMTVLQYVFFAMNWPEAATEQSLQAMVSAGYKYNWWGAKGEPGLLS